MGASVWVEVDVGTESEGGADFAVRRDLHPHLPARAASLPQLTRDNPNTTQGRHGHQQGRDLCRLPSVVTLKIAEYDLGQLLTLLPPSPAVPSAREAVTYFLSLARTTSSVVTGSPAPRFALHH
ncbi:hypothetical protein E2C01_007694 [Portunus trituberculatus]|uniref:Uncharacterized protein n=1 Tax=Portunus trituberculatus TaxID=210409 RepID=A0A5B7D328_PORTR|nr:hypothetical protein [Portunus trituberculatus]